MWLAVLSILFFHVSHIVFTLVHNVGKLLTDSYMKRKKAVQEAVQRKINADKMRLFNNKGDNSNAFLR
jgi:hypothetical protein